MKPTRMRRVRLMDGQSRPSRRAVQGLLAALVCLAAALGTPAGARAADPAAQAPDIWSLELGAGFGRVTLEPPGTNSQFARVRYTRPGDFMVDGAIGRAERFGDVSVDFGASATKTVHRWDLSAGLASGTGEFIAPRWRLDLGIRREVAPGLIGNLGYTHIQSKSVNSSDGGELGLAWYALPHLLLGAVARNDWGWPGGSPSPSVTVSAAWYEWRRWSVGGSARFGNVAYTLVGPTNSLVDYPSQGYTANATWWRTDHDGFILDLEYSDNDFYTSRGVMLRWFREWR